MFFKTIMQAGGMALCVAVYLLIVDRLTGGIYGKRGSKKSPLRKPSQRH